MEIHSLVGRPELNGRAGTVSGLKPDGSGRVGVKVDGEEGLVALKPATLTLLGGASAVEDAAAATKAAEARSAAVRLASSVAKAHTPPTVLWTCRFCRNALAPTSFSPRERPKAASRRCCTGCDFRVRDEDGLRYAKAVAACIVLQARARGSLVRCGKALASAPHGDESDAPKPTPTPATQGATHGAHQGAAAQADAAEAELAAPTPKELALSCAVALFDQMASAGIAPPALVPLRPRLPALAEFAYERNTGGLVDALSAAGMSDLKLLQQGAMAIMELVGAAGEAAAAEGAPPATAGGIVV